MSILGLLLPFNLRRSVTRLQHFLRKRAIDADTHRVALRLETSLIRRDHDKRVLPFSQKPRLLLSGISRERRRVDGIDADALRATGLPPEEDILALVDHRP